MQTQTINIVTDCILWNALHAVQVYIPGGVVGDGRRVAVRRSLGYRRFHRVHVKRIFH